MLRWRSWESNPVPLAYGTMMLSERSTLKRSVSGYHPKAISLWVEEYEQMSYIPVVEIGKQVPDGAVCG